MNRDITASFQRIDVGLFFSRSSVFVSIVVVGAVAAALVGVLMVEGQQSQVKSGTRVHMRYGDNSTRGGPDIVVNQGYTVRIGLVNNNILIHYWVLDANSPSPYNVESTRISGLGNSRTIEFVVSFPGGL